MIMRAKLHHSLRVFDEHQINGNIWSANLQYKCLEILMLMIKYKNTLFSNNFLIYLEKYKYF